MKPLLYLFIISIFALCYCNSKDSKTPMDNKSSIIGKWHRFSFENGYTEFEIDSQYVVFFNQKTGISKHEYKIENDSFKYITHNYSAKIIPYGDSIIFKGNDNTTATLHRFDESDVPFTSIPDEEDTLLLQSYEKEFDKRAINEWEKAGFIISDW